MKELLTKIIEAIIDYPENLTVNEVHSELTTIYDVNVDPRDTGKVIGKGGRIADALRTIIISAGAKQGRRYIIQILEDQ